MNTKRAPTDIAELINRRRRQLLVHSIIYYRFDKNIVSDSVWTKWAIELADLQKQYPDIAKTVPYHEDFKDFDPSTGFNLPLFDPWGECTAIYLLKIYNKI